MAERKPRRREWSAGLDMETVPDEVLRDEANRRWSTDLGTVPFELLRSEWNRRAQAMRQTFAGGRPAVKRPCQYCHKEFGAAELRAHRPRCPKRFKRVKKVKAEVAA